MLPAGRDGRRSCIALFLLRVSFYPALMPDLSKFPIDRKPHESPVHDLMDNCSRWEIKVHDHGLVALVDVMPRLAPVGKTADYAIVQAARVSYGEGTKQITEARGIIRYLARHRHTAP